MRFDKSVVINRPVDAVFAFVTDFNKVPLWMPVSNLRQTSEGPIGVGSTFAQSVEIFGQRFDGVIQITSYEPTRAFAFKVVQGPFPLANSMTFVPLDANRTNLTMVGEAEPGKVLKMAGPLLGPMVKKQLETQVSTLKRLLES